MKMFLGDIIVYNDMDIHLDKFNCASRSAKEFGISLNLDKLAFMVFSRMILGLVV
jgi:hypothetical protein